MTKPIEIDLLHPDPDDTSGCAGIMAALLLTVLGVALAAGLILGTVKGW